MKTLAILTCLLLAGCAGPTTAPDTGDPVTGPSDGLRNETTDAPTETQLAIASRDAVTLTGCMEMQSEYLFDAAEYAPLLPDGFTLADQDGQAVITVLSWSCGGGQMGVHFVALLVEPPADQHRDGAEHMLAMEDAWVDGDQLDRLFAQTHIPSEARDFDISTLYTAGGATDVLRSDPDWFIQIAGATAVNARYDEVRYFGARWDEQAQRAAVTGSVDIARPPTEAWEGPAHAHSLPLVDGALLPFDQQGEGRVPAGTADVVFTA